MIGSAWAFHDTMGGSSTTGHMLPLLVIVVVIAVGLIFLGGRKKSAKGKPGRARKRNKRRR